MKILILNGPNLNMLGVREPGVYGKESLQDIEANIQKLSNELDFDYEFFQSNAEHEIVNKVQSALGEFNVIILILEHLLTLALPSEMLCLRLLFPFTKYIFQMSLLVKILEKNLIFLTLQLA